MTNIICRQ